VERPCWRTHDARPQIKYIAAAVRSGGALFGAAGPSAVLDERTPTNVLDCEDRADARHQARDAADYVLCGGCPDHYGQAVKLAKLGIIYLLKRRSSVVVVDKEASGGL